MTTIYIAYGLPCVGKSTFSKTLDNVFVLSSDDLIMRVAQEHGITDYNTAYYYFGAIADNKEMQKKLAELYVSRGKDIFYDRTNLYFNKRRMIVDYAKSINARLVGITFDPPKEVHDRLIAGRPEKVISSSFFAGNYDPLTYEEGYKELYNYNYETNQIDLIKKG